MAASPSDIDGIPTKFGCRREPEGRQDPKRRPRRGPAKRAGAADRVAAAQDAEHAGPDLEELAPLAAIADPTGLGRPVAGGAVRAAVEGTAHGARVADRQQARAQVIGQGAGPGAALRRARGRIGRQVRAGAIGEDRRELAAQVEIEARGERTRRLGQTASGAIEGIGGGRRPDRRAGQAPEGYFTNSTSTRRPVVGSMVPRYELTLRAISGLSDSIK